MNPNKKQLQKLIEDLKTKKFREGEAKGLMSEIQKEQTSALKPVLESISKEIGEATKEAIASAMKDFKIDIPKQDAPEVNVNVPDVYVPEIKIPEIKIPEIKLPTINIPETKIDFPTLMEVWGEVGLAGVDKLNPLPVMMVDNKGNLMQFSFGGGSGGGRADFFTIKGFEQSAFSQLTNPDGRLKVELPSGSSGLTDTELRASHLDVDQVSGSAWSVYVKEIFGSAISSLLNGDNRIPVSVETGGSGLTDSELRATAVPVEQVSGASWSISATDLDIRDLSPTTDGIRAYQVSGESFSVNVVGASASIAVVNIDRDGNPQQTWLVSDITASLKSALVDSTGVQYSGSNPVPVNVVSQSLASSASALVDSTGVQYSGSNPLPIGGTLTGITNAIEKRQVSGVADSINIIQIGGNTISTGSGVSGTGVIRVMLASNSNMSTQTLTDAIANADQTAEIAFNAGFNGSTWDRLHTQGGDSAGALRVVHATDAIASVNITGASGTIAVVGTVAPDTADDGAPPVKTGGVARTANPTAVANGDAVSATYDDLGRQTIRVNQVRDLINTAYVAVSTGTETTLLAGTAGFFNDLIYILASNNSTASVGIDIRAVSAGNILLHLEIPANATTGLSLPTPIPQDATGNNWTVDLPDITGTTVYVSALFSKEL